MLLRSTPRRIVPNEAIQPDYRAHCRLLGSSKVNNKCIDIHA